jgi:P27 family predicted phage terminase small subunit
MTKPGPKPKPTKIRVFEGNPGNIPLNPNEPDPMVLENTDPPKWIGMDCAYMNVKDAEFPLEEVTNKIWEELMPELKRLGVLTEIDRNKFARYCEIFARWLKMKAFIDKHGEVYPVYIRQYEAQVDPETGEELKREDGSVIHKMRKHLKSMNVYPQVAIYQKLASDLHKYESEYGIGAASRTRISAIAEFGLKNKQPPANDDFNYAAKIPLRAVK